MCPEVLPAAEMTKRQAKPSKEKNNLMYIKEYVGQKI